jgi:hypothetical protein
LTAIEKKKKNKKEVVVSKKFITYLVTPMTPSSEANDWHTTFLALLRNVKIPGSHAIGLSENEKGVAELSLLLRQMFSSDMVIPCRKTLKKARESMAMSRFVKYEEIKAGPLREVAQLLLKLSVMETKILFGSLKLLTTSLQLSRAYNGVVRDMLIPGTDLYKVASIAKVAQKKKGAAMDRLDMSLSHFPIRKQLEEFRFSVFEAVFS